MKNPVVYQQPVPEQSDKSRDVVVDRRARLLNPRRLNVGEGEWLTRDSLTLADRQHQQFIESLERRAGVR